MWLRLLPTLTYKTLQCGFVPRVQAAEGVYVVKRSIELSREWSTPLHALKIDLSKAFDSVHHSSTLLALHEQGATPQCMAILATLLDQHAVAPRLGPHHSESIHMHRGLLQGAPESP
eukprot:3822222-Prorocentrum_lima.AAC.1